MQPHPKKMQLLIWQQKYTFVEHEWFFVWDVKHFLNGNEKKLPYKKKANQKREKYSSLSTYSTYLHTFHCYSLG